MVGGKINGTTIRVCKVMQLLMQLLLIDLILWLLVCY